MRLRAGSSHNGSPQHLRMVLFMGIGMIMGSLLSSLLSTPAALYAQSNSPLTIQAETGRVGIGTTNPGAKLHVQGDGQLVNIGDNSGTSARYASFDTGAAGGVFVGIDSSTGGAVFSGTAPNSGSIGTTGGSPFHIATQNSVRVTVDAPGNVGIGTAAPTQKLDVVGNTNVSGAYYIGGVAGITSTQLTNFEVSCGSDWHGDFRGGILVRMFQVGHGSCGDIAETYSSSETLQPGDVVAVDPLQDESIVKTTKPYQATAIGVISTKPYLFPGSDTHTYPLGLVGRLPVNTSTENGSIQRGDYLTSASRPGYAMKATRPGRVIGVALQPLAAGEGKIIAFINPQWFFPEAAVQAAR